MMVTPWWKQVSRNTYVAYFTNTNGVYTGDEIRILGVAVGTVEKIDPQPNAAKVTFTVDSQYPVPADVRAAILSPSLVTARAIQLVPVYSGGPKLADGATIPEDRTAVPVEWDDLRQQLEKLTDSLQPTTQGGTSPLGEFINTSAANLRGEGDTARDTVIKLSQAVSALGDHSTDIFSTVRNLQLLVSALTSSSELLAVVQQKPGQRHHGDDQYSQRVGPGDAGLGRRGQRSAPLRRRQPRGPRHHLRPPQRDHHGAERQPR